MCTATYVEIRLGSWDSVASLADDLQATKRPWLFRGHQDASWRLQTTLERARRQYGKPKGQGSLGDVERRILTSFRRTAHLHGKALPREDSAKDGHDGALVEWLALVQHYGGPTRLLDFTHSFWAALFFAVDVTATAQQAELQAVWAVDGRRLWRTSVKRTREKGNAACQIASKRRAIARRLCGQAVDVSRSREERDDSHETPPLALPVEPERKNARMTAQQGGFIFPLNADRPFEDNLFGVLGVDPRTPDRCIDYAASTDLEWGRDTTPALAKVLLPKGCARQKGTHRTLAQMGITWLYLFPDLYGAAKSTYEALL